MKNWGIKAVLQETKKIKEQERDLQCMKCDKDFVLFSTREALNTHIRAVHMNSRPFKCGECINKTFKHKYHLIKHVSSVHGEAKDTKNE